MLALVGNQALNLGNLGKTEASTSTTTTTTTTTTLAKCLFNATSISPSPRVAWLINSVGHCRETRTTFCPAVAKVKTFFSFQRPPCSSSGDITRFPESGRTPIVRTNCDRPDHKRQHRQQSRRQRQRQRQRLRQRRRQRRRRRRRQRRRRQRQRCNSQLHEGVRELNYQRFH